MCGKTFKKKKHVIVCAICVANVACELHVAGNLASSIVAGCKNVAAVFTKSVLVALTLVTVVISITLSKLPQLTTSEVAKALALTDPTSTSYLGMAAKAAPSLLTHTLRIMSVFVPGPVGTALVLASDGVAAASGDAPV